MFGRPLCTAAFVFALAVFITLQVFPPQLDPYPELDREEAVLSGTIDSIEYKQDYKQSYARRGAQDGQQKQKNQKNCDCFFHSCLLLSYVVNGVQSDYTKVPFFFQVRSCGFFCVCCRFVNDVLQR